MIIDFYAHYGCGPGMPHCYGSSELLSLQKSSGIDVTVASDLGTAFGETKIGQGDTPDGLIRFEGITPETDLTELESAQSLKGVRIYPTYQKWDFEGKAMADLLSLAKAKKLIVQFCLRLQDPRVLLQTVPSGEVLAALDGLIQANNEVKFVITSSNLGETGGNPSPFKHENAWSDVSQLQHPTNSLPKCISIIGSERLLFASDSPIFYPYMAVFRMLHEHISDEDRERILVKNAQELLNI